ncbi:MAG: hypothetical protein GTO02_14550, partial [Candidatus Dadabacteria bacterium]|nr:hypothetical protein [Candidatus Dadabacteria bacterium]
YILSSDSSDVVVVGDLLNIVQKFESFDCEMVFNAEKNIWPTDLSKNMIEFEKARAGDYIFAFLNAGLWIGKTDFVKRVIREMFTYKFKTKHTMSEQIYYKFLQFHHPDDIKLDYKCQIFQNINRVDENLIGFVK